MPGHVHSLCDDVRVQLADAISQQITNNGWTQSEAAQRLGVSQPRISHLVNGQTSRFTVDALLNLATLAGLQIQISVKPR